MNIMNIERLKSKLEEFYQIYILKIELIREMIGAVYFIETQTDKLILKLYNSNQLDLCIKSAFVMNELAKELLTPKPLTNKNDSLWTKIELDKFQYYGLLMEYIDGSDVESFPLNSDSIEFMERVHLVLQNCSKHLPEHGYEFYIERFLILLSQKNYSKSRFLEFKDMASFLYQHMSKCPKSVCHGDFHTGNMKISNGQIIVFDFDACANASRLYDYATIFDASNFNVFHEKDYFETKNRFMQISKNNTELIGMLSFVPIRHFELIATIGFKQGIHRISEAFLEQQYHWVKNWLQLIKKDITEFL